MIFSELPLFALDKKKTVIILQVEFSRKESDGLWHGN
jgi:hypothetical protein